MMNSDQRAKNLMVRDRLSGHGDVHVDNDSRYRLHLMKPRGESWDYALKRAVVATFPAARVVLVRARPAADPYFAHYEVVFEV